MYDRVMDRVVGRMTQTAARLTSAGRKMAISVTAPLLAIATMSTMAAGKFEYSAARIQGAANLTDTQLGAMKGSVLTLSKELGMRPSGLIDSFEELIKGGMHLDEILAGAGKAAGMLAKVGEVDSGTAAKTLVKILSVFKSENMTAADAANILSAAADASVISIQDMIHAISQGSSTAAIANQSFKDFSAAIGILGQAGLVSRDAGTSLKTFFLSLVSAERQKFFEKYGLSVKTASGQIKPFRDLIANLGQVLAKLTPAKQLQAVSEMFGTDAARAAIILSRAGTEGFDAMRTKMNGALTVQEKYALLMETFLGQTDRLLSLFERIGIELGNHLIPVLKAVGDQIEGLITWWEKLNPAQKQAIFQISLYAAAAGPALVVSGYLIEMVRRLSLSFWRLSSAVASSLIVLGRFTLYGMGQGVALGRAIGVGILSGIVGTSGYFVQVGKLLGRLLILGMSPFARFGLWLFGPFVGDMIKLTGFVGKFLIRSFIGIAAEIGTLFGLSFIARATGSLVRGSGSIAMALGSAFMSVFRSMPAIAGGLGLAFSTMLGTVPRVFGALRLALVTVLGPIIPWLTSMGTAVVRLLTATIMPVVGLIGGAVSSVIGFISTTVMSALSGIAAIVGWPAVIVAGIVSVMGAISWLILGTDGISKAFSSAWSYIKEFFLAAIGWVANFGDNFYTTITWLSENWKNVLSDMAQLMGLFVGNMTTNAMTALMTLFRMFSAFGGWLTSLWDRIWTIDFWKSIWKGISAALQMVKDFVTKVVSALWEAAKAGAGWLWNLMTGKGSADESIKDSFINSLNISPVGDFNQARQEQDLLGTMGRILSEQSGLLRTPFEGFQSSIKEGPQYKYDSAIVDWLRGKTDLPINLPDMPTLPPPPNLLNMPEGGKPSGILNLPNENNFAPQSFNAGNAQSPGDTFKEISLRRFAIEGPGGLARPSQKQQAVSAPGVETRLDAIHRTLKNDRAITR